MAENLRYGTSALDIKHKAKAEADELLVDGTTGKIFYKRQDGAIVSHDVSGVYNHAKVDTGNLYVETDDMYFTKNRDFKGHLACSVFKTDNPETTKTYMTDAELAAIKNLNAKYQGEE